MAVQRRSLDPELDALISAAAAEVLRLNPHLGDPAPVYDEREIAEIAAEDQSLEDLWNTPEGQRAQQLDFSAADAVNEERGE